MTKINLSTQSMISLIFQTTWKEASDLRLKAPTATMRSSNFRNPNAGHTVLWQLSTCHVTSCMFVSDTQQ